MDKELVHALKRMSYYLLRTLLNLFELNNMITEFNYSEELSLKRIVVLCWFECFTNGVNDKNCPKNNDIGRF